MAERESNVVKLTDSVPGVAERLAAARKRLDDPVAAPTAEEIVKLGQEQIKAPIATAPVEPTPPPAEEAGFRPRSNSVLCTFENTRSAILQLGVEVRYDVFHSRMMVNGHEVGRTKAESLDNLVLAVRRRIAEEFKFEPGSMHVRDALNSIAQENHFDPVLDYINELVWDGKPRLDEFTVRYLGADATPLNRAVGRKMLVAAVRRVRHPGCKFDYIVVLDRSRQGAGKSTALNILAGDDNFSDSEILTLDEKRQMEQIQGVWIYEIGELSGLRKADVEKVKQFASRREDRARPAYGHDVVRCPRRCIFVGTTNTDEYLRDPTGNRRFWPLTPGKIDLAALRADRDQLWAEAAACEAAGEELTIPEELWSEMAERQQSRMLTDPWEDLLSKHLPDPTWRTIQPEGVELVKDVWRVSTAYVLQSVLKIEPGRQSRRESIRLGPVMNKLGWSGPGPIRFKRGLVVQGYQRADKPAVSALDRMAGEVARPEGKED